MWRLLQSSNDNAFRYSRIDTTQSKFLMYLNQDIQDLVMILECKDVCVVQACDGKANDYQLIQYVGGGEIRTVHNISDH